MHAGLQQAAQWCENPTVALADIIDRADDALSHDGADEVHQPTLAECFDELLADFEQGESGVTSGQLQTLDDVLALLGD